MRFLLVVSFLLCAQAASAKKYAVIVNGGDNGQSGANVGSDGTLLRNHFNTLASAEAAFYRSQGYEVITVDANAGATAATFRDAVGSIRDADELAVGIFAHGQLLNGGFYMSDSNRFPRSYVRSDEYESRMNDAISDTSNRFAFYLARPGNQSDKIGLGDIYRALASAKLNNPRMVTTINSLSCYGGNAVRALESIPDTQVFSASDTTSPSYVLYAGPASSPSSVLADYSQFLIRAQGRGLSMLEAHLQAKRDYDDVAISRDTAHYNLTRPSNSLEVKFADLCLGAPRPAEIARCNFSGIAPEGVNELSRTIAQTHFFSFMSRDLEEEERFWLTMQRSACSEWVDGQAPPASLIQSFVRTMTAYYDGVDPGGQGSTKYLRMRINNWRCPTYLDCDFANVMSTSDGTQAGNTPAPELVRSTLDQQCPFRRDPGIPDPQRSQIECVYRYGATQPVLAVKMLALLQEKGSRHRDACGRSNRALGHLGQLRTCLRTLNQRGTDEFWREVTNLLAIGSRLGP